MSTLGFLVGIIGVAIICLIEDKVDDNKKLKYFLISLDILIVLTLPLLLEVFVF